MRRAIFLDRDRTLIADAPPGSASRAAHEPEHVVLLPGATEALRLAKGSGYLLVVVTNQPGPAKGEYTHAQVVATHARLSALCADAGVALDAIYACEHHPVGGDNGDSALIRSCDCRKPEPGLLVTAARDLDIDLDRSAFIGDDDRDLDAGLAAGVRTYRVGPKGTSILCAVRTALVDLATIGTEPKELEHADLRRYQ